LCQVKSLPGVGDLASDELLHDLVGSSVDGLDARVNVVLANVVLPHVSPAAVELDSVVGDLVLKVSAPVLGHGSLVGLRCEERSDEQKVVSYCAMLYRVFSLVSP